MSYKRVMATRYPIEFKRGKLVRHLKPQKPIFAHQRFETSISGGESLWELVEWVRGVGGELDQALIHIGYDSIAVVEVCIPMSFEEKLTLQKNYERSLKEWEEWRELSKTAIATEQEKEKATRAKSLETQERNLLKKLAQIRKQKESI
jgi:hypothetical protein